MKADKDTPLLKHPQKRLLVRHLLNLCTKHAIDQSEIDLSLGYTENKAHILELARPQELVAADWEKLGRDYARFMETEGIHHAFEKAAMHDTAKRAILLVRRGWHTPTETRLRKWGIPYRLAVSRRDNQKRHIMIQAGNVQDAMLVAARLRDAGMPVRFCGVWPPLKP